ncbi:hypothetical protein Peur_035185 [Populus x canadensis]
MTMSVPPFNVSGENHLEELQHFPFICNHLIPVAATTQTVGDYNLNFTISSSLAAGFNRGTLQYNPHVTLGSGCPNDPSFAGFDSSFSCLGGYGVELLLFSHGF